MFIERPGDSTIADTAPNDQTSSVEMSESHVEQPPSDQEINKDDTDDDLHADHGAVKVIMVASPTAPSRQEGSSVT